MSSINSLQKAQLRPGDFHLRDDARRMFGNYVELCPLGRIAAFPSARQAATLAATPVYDEAQLWEIELLFSAPQGIFPVGPIAPTPWIPSGFNFDLEVTLTAAVDRDKQTQTEMFILNPLDFGLQNTFPIRFKMAQQLTLTAKIIGSTSQLLGVQASISRVNGGARDAYGSALVETFDQSQVSQLFLAPNALRRQFFVQNWGSTPLFIAFAQAAGAPGSSTPWTIGLPNRGDIYESPRDCWQGYVSGVWTANAPTASDVAAVTEGT